MSAPLRGAFEDLATEAPEPGELAASTWAAGRRRRVRRRAGVAAVCVALVAAVLVAGPRLRHQPPPIGSDPSSGVHSYPQRFGHQGSFDDLPDAPGALAATFTNNNFGDSFTVLVSPTGETWGSVDRGAVLSPDGTLVLSSPFVALGMPADRADGALAVRNLVSGETRTLEAMRPYVLATSSPMIWSPDNSSVLVSGRIPRSGTGDVPLLLDVSTGEVRPLGTGVPVGFRSALEAVTLRQPGGPVATTPPTVVTTNIRTGDSTERVLPGSRPIGALRAVTTSLSPNGSTLLVISREEDRYSELRMFDLARGKELPPRQVRDWEGAGCATAWIGDDPVLPTKRLGSQARSILVTADGDKSLVALHPSNQSFCIQWAADAIAGGPQPALFGSWSAWWTWHWQQLAVGVGALLGGAYLVLRRRRLSRP